MPKFMQDFNIPGGGGFAFSGIRPEDLEETEYTLVNIIIDISGSVDAFKDGLLNTLKDAINACKKSPKSANLLVRVVTFNSHLSEVHGFKPVNEIDVNNDYKQFKCGSMTALYDATYDGVGSIIKYADILSSNDFTVNGIVFIITDGGDNSSRMTPAMINDKIIEVIKNEQMDSLTTVLVGINTDDYKQAHENFKNQANLNQYIDVGDVTPGKLAKLAAFVSRSVSSTSQVLGTGASAGPLIF